MRLLKLTSSHGVGVGGVVVFDEIETLKMERGGGGGAFIPFGRTRLCECMRMSLHLEWRMFDFLTRPNVGLECSRRGLVC